MGAGVGLRGLERARAVNHIVTGNYWAFELAGGKTIEDVGTALDGDVLGTDPLRLRRLVAGGGGGVPRAGRAGPSLRGVVRPVPGSVCTAGTASSTCWSTDDVAASTGQDTRLDPELVAACWAVVEPQLDELGGSGVRHPRDPARRRRAGPASSPRSDATRRAVRRPRRATAPQVTCGLTRN